MKLSLLALAAASAQAGTLHLTQADFANGPLLVSEPTNIIFDEDIVVGQGWDTSDFFIPDTVSGTPLGFFAGIVVQSDRVNINLNGHTMTQDPDFLKVQRFYAHIELGSKPFVPPQGPADFGDFTPVSHVFIHNGTLGSSSHHGIHGSDVTAVTIQDLVIKDFEVAAIQLNGAKSSYLGNLDIGPASTNVPWLGSFSQAVFLLPQLRAAVAEDPDFVTTFQGQDITLADLLADLEAAMNNAENEVLFNNPTGLPDASALYGLVLHKVGVAVGDFGAGEDTLKDNIAMENINIHDLHLSSISWGISQGVVGPFGDQLNFNWAVDANGAWKVDASGKAGNALFRAQLGLANFRNTNAFQGFGGPHTLSASPDVLAWAAGDSSVFDEDWWAPVCDQDLMAHVMKGSMGVRTEFYNRVVAENVNVADVSVELREAVPWCPEPRLLSTGFSAGLHARLTLEDCSASNTGDSGVRISDITNDWIDVETCGVACSIANWDGVCLNGNNVAQC